MEILATSVRSMESHILVERHADGYVAYAHGVNGAAVGQGETHEEALADTESALRFDQETVGEDALLPVQSADPGLTGSPNTD